VQRGLGKIRTLAYGIFCYKTTHLRGSANTAGAPLGCGKAEAAMPIPTEYEVDNMARQMETLIDTRFSERTRTPKGRATLQAILEATFDLATTQGLRAASQEAIARRTGLTQSAVRHYFPTKSDLLDAFFWYGAQKLEQQFIDEFRKTDIAPRTRLLSLANLHYELIMKVDDSAYFETLSIWSRTPEYRMYRDSFEHRVRGYYADLLQLMHPEWDEKRCAATAFQLLTLVLGGWQSLGGSSTMQPRRGRKALKAILLEGIERLIE
jgi:AcrR family transcriptional regulator